MATTETSPSLYTAYDISAKSRDFPALGLLCGSNATVEVITRESRCQNDHTNFSEETGDPVDGVLFGPADIFSHLFDGMFVPIEDCTNQSAG